MKLYNVTSFPHLHCTQSSSSGLAGAANAVVCVTNILCFVVSKIHLYIFRHSTNILMHRLFPLKALLRTLNIYINLIGINSTMLGSLLGCVSKPRTPFDEHYFMGKLWNESFSLTRFFFDTSVNEGSICHIILLSEYQIL